MHRCMISGRWSQIWRLLWQKKLRDYQRPARSKPIGALVPTSSNREEYVSQAREAFAEGMAEAP